MEQLNFNIVSEEDTTQIVADQRLSPGSKEEPLAARMRPHSFDDYIGQQHILAEGKLLRRAIQADKFSSLIFSGPPGVGKTTLAELVAQSTDCAFIRLSGVLSNVADIRREISAAILRKTTSGRNTILFIDEIHRFNKAQQDVLLPDVENGNIRLIGATTQNPNFFIISALLSRSLVFQLESLNQEGIRQVIKRAINDERGFPDRVVAIEDAALDFLADICEGDARKALNALEIAVLSTAPGNDNTTLITLETAEASIQKRAVVYEDDGHYDTASAFIKSMRGSDPDAAVYWLAKMLHAGEDIRFIARRIVIFASEDIGNADPRALTLAVSTMQAIDLIGMPEARIILSQAVTYCATAPKSNASYSAVNQALEDIKTQRVEPVPMHLRDSHSAAKRNDSGETSYQYPHDFEGHFIKQNYIGIPKSYYQPAKTGYESKILERMNYWQQLREPDSELKKNAVS